MVPAGGASGLKVGQKGLLENLTKKVLPEK